MTLVPSLQSIKERFESANKLILEHSNFDDEARNIAATHSVSYMHILTKIIENSDGQLTQDAMHVLNDVLEFLDLVEGHCAVESGESPQLDKWASADRTAKNLGS